MAEYVPVQYDRAVAIKVRKECLEIRGFLKRDELIAVDKSYPGITERFVCQTMRIGLDLLRAPWIARIIVANEPRVYGDVIAMPRE